MIIMIIIRIIINRRLSSRHADLFTVQKIARLRGIRVARVKFTPFGRLWRNGMIKLYIRGVAAARCSRNDACLPLSYIFNTFLVGALRSLYLSNTRSDVWADCQVEDYYLRKYGNHRSQWGFSSASQSSPDIRWKFSPFESLLCRQKAFIRSPTVKHLYCRSSSLIQLSCIY